MGVFITLENLSAQLLAEAASVSIYNSPGWDKGYARLQIFTIADLLTGAEVKTPSASITFKQAEKVKSSEAEQKKLLTVIGAR